VFDAQKIKDKLKEIKDKLDCGDNQILENLNFFDRPVDYSDHLMFIPFKPKQPIKNLSEKVVIFMSKKKPLLISAEVYQPDNVLPVKV
jgi:hypothetical protein